MPRPLDLDLRSTDEDAAIGAVDTLLQRFGEWQRRGSWPGPATVDDAALALDWKWRRADGHLGWWVRPHIDDLLLEELPARYDAAPGQAATVPSSLAALFAFLDAEGLLDADSDAADELIARSRALERSFLDAMEDSNRFGMTKRIFEAMGIDDPTGLTQSDVDDVMARFNALSFEERGAILGFDDGPGPDEVEARPPVPLRLRDLPANGELDLLAEEVPLLQRVDALWEAIGDGVGLTKAGNLKLADGRRLVERLGLEDPAATVRSTADLPRLFSVVQTALLARALDREGSRLVPRPGWPGRSAGERWESVVDGVLEIGVATSTFGAHHTSPLELAAEGDSAALYLLALLWMSDEPLPESTLEDMLVDGLDVGMVPPSFFRFGREPLERSCRARAADALATLVDAGLVEIAESHLRLCRGGDRLAVPWLREIGFHATRVEDLVALDAETLLDRLAADDVPATDELADAWLAGGDDRAAELVGSAIARPEPARVLSALALLQRGGDDAIAAISAARDSVIGPSAWMWLADRGIVGPADLPPGVGQEAGVVTMLALLDTGSAADVVESLLGGVPAAEHAQLVEHLATAQHPRTAELLEQLGRHHPDKAVGKHARKLAHRWRSAHGARR